MKKSILVFASLLLTLTLYSQNDRYMETMQRTIDALESASGEDNYLNCAGQFERIAVAEKDRWMPFYYGSYSLVQLSFNENDGARRDQLLDRAQDMLDRALELAPEESELYVLQAFLYPSRIMVDPMVRGMEYMDKCFATLEKAKALNPENPRAYFLEAMNMLNMPPSFGGGAEVARPIFETADEKFKAFRKDDPIWPDWGEEANRAELKKLME